METIPYVTLWTIAVLALMSIPMGISVGLRRAKTGIMLLHGDDDILLRRMRAHANFAEYVPIALLALAAADIGGSPDWLLVTTGTLLVAGRVVHYFGLLTAPDHMGRLVGAALTSLSILLVSIGVVWQLVLAA